LFLFLNGFFGGKEQPMQIENNKKIKIIGNIAYPKLEGG